MKKLKFKHDLVKLILDGTKTVTWRLFDDKDLNVGDSFELIDSETGKNFAEAEIIEIKEKKLGEVEEKDLEGHERYNSEEAMMETYKKYYGRKTTPDSIVKMISFKLR